MLSAALRRVEAGVSGASMTFSNVVAAAVDACCKTQLARLAYLINPTIFIGTWPEKKAQIVTATDRINSMVVKPRSRLLFGPAPRTGSPQL